MTHVFNSLGSNYSFKICLTALGQIFLPNKTHQQKLMAELAAKFKGQVVLTYKGRDAIEYALRSLGVTQGDLVLTQAFCCSAIESAILRTGAKPLYADLEKNSLTPSVATFEKAVLLSQKKPQALLLQHTLGIVGPISEIYRWAKKNSIPVIEDLAQAYGATSKDGRLLGAQADLVILSFGRDKILDAVSGGAVITNLDPDSSSQHSLTILPNLPYKAAKLAQLKDMTYPFLTWLIRVSYSCGIGKIIHRLLVLIHWLKSPILTDTQQMSCQPPEYAPLVLEQLHQLSAQLSHRQQISQVYFQNLKNVAGLKVLFNQEDINDGSNLRFPIQVNNPTETISKLESSGWHLGDRWYRAPVDGGRNFVSTEYISGTCPQAEILSQTCLNLPTHRLMTPAKAQELANRLKEIFHD